MVNKLFGKKIGMSRYFLDGGRSVPVTVVQLEPCIVTQKKTKEREGYNALQVGFQPQKENRVNKPLKGHFKKSGETYFARLREIPVEDPEDFEVGQEIGADIFSSGDTVQISGYSKGRGFTGVMKRWGFSGGEKTHGSRSKRVPGSIGCSAYPGRVLKGKKLPGRMGGRRVTVKNLKVIDVRPEMKVLVIEGPLPGSRNSIVEILKV